MKIKTIAASAALTIASALMITTPAAATDGPFKNCTEAREAGHSNIPQGSEYYASKLDRDGDGYGCDKHGTLANDGKEKTGVYAESDEPEVETTETSDTDLAETGGDSNTPYIAAAGGVLLLGGAGAVLISRRRKSTV